MLRWLYIGFGALSVVAGLITFWLPLPIGIPLLLIGLPVLMKYSPHTRSWILRRARRWPLLEKSLRQLRLARRRRD